MDITITDSQQAEAAVDQMTTTPSPDISSASEALTLAQITGASDLEIQSLQAEVNRHRGQAAAQTQETQPEQTEPEPAKAEAGTEPVETTEGAEQDDDKTEEPAGETPQDQPDFKVSERPRITHLSDEDKLAANAINLLTRKGLSLAEATHRVLGSMATSPAQEPEPEPVQQVVTPEVAAAKADVERLTARQTALKDILKNAAQDEVLFGADIEAANSELIDVSTALVEAKVMAKLAEREQAQLAEKQSELDAQAAKNWSDLTGKYPDLTSGKSHLYLLVGQTAQEAHSDANHPLHQYRNRPDFNRRCVELAAKELKVVPQGDPTAPVTAKLAKSATQTVQAQSTVSRPGPASGSRSTTPQAPAPTAAMRIAQSEAALNAVLDGDMDAYRVARPSGFVR